MERVQVETFGRKLSGKKDTLTGYVLAEVKITDESVLAKSEASLHPILRYTGNFSDQVEGIIFQISDNELQEADGYEVDAYKRIKAKFQSGIKAWVYVAAE